MYRTLGVVVLILALVAAVLLVAGCPGPKKPDMTPGGMMPMKGGPGPGMTPPPPMTPPPAVGEEKGKTAPVPGEEKGKAAPAAVKGPEKGAVKMPPPPPPAPK